MASVKSAVMSWIEANSLPDLPEGYSWEMVTSIALILRHNKDGVVGTFTLLHDAKSQTDKWAWHHNFRTSTFDTLEDGVAVVTTKHRLGGINNDRQVF